MNRSNRSDVCTRGYRKAIKVPIVLDDGKVRWISGASVCASLRSGASKRPTRQAKMRCTSLEHTHTVFGLTKDPSLAYVWNQTMKLRFRQLGASLAKIGCHQKVLHRC